MRIRSISLAPLIITALSVPFLGERVGWHRWAAISIGFCGVLVMLQPSASSVITLGALAALRVGDRLCGERDRRFACRSKTDSNIERRLLVAVHHDGHQHGDCAADLGADSRPSTSDGSSRTASPAHSPSLMLTIAFRPRRRSVIAPFEYTALLWGVMIDWLVWDTLADAARLHRWRHRVRERSVGDLARGSPQGRAASRGDERAPASTDAASATRAQTGSRVLVERAAASGIVDAISMTSSPSFLRAAQTRGRQHRAPALRPA